MKVVSSRINLNLHSPSTNGGLIHLMKDKAARVPDDVEEHPAFRQAVDCGTIAVISEQPDPKPEPEESDKEPEDEDSEEEPEK